jgi:hypothetical protein
LSRLQHNRSSNLFALPRNAAVATVVCLILLALLAVVQVAHVHPLSSDADSCPLCIVLHSAAPVAAAVVAVILVQLGAAAPVVETRSVARPWQPTLFTRPPPTV